MPDVCRLLTKLFKNVLVFISLKGRWYAGKILLSRITSKSFTPVHGQSLGSESGIVHLS